MPDGQIILNILYLFIMGGIAIGGIASYRMSTNRTKSDIKSAAVEVQDHVISALRAEIQTLNEQRVNEQRINEQRIYVLEKKNIRLEQTLGIIKSAFKKKGINITIDGDMVSISDASGNTHEARITGTIGIVEGA